MTESHVSPSGFPWVCACATRSCAIFALVGLLTGSDVITHMASLGKYESALARPEVPYGCSLGRSRLLLPTGTSHFTGYLPLSPPFSWGALSIEAHPASIQACDWLRIEAALTFFFLFFLFLFFFFWYQSYYFWSFFFIAQV